MKQGIIQQSIRKYKDSSATAKTALWVMICSILQKSIGIITLPLFTRIMTTTQYGQFTVYHSWLNILTIITTLRLNYAVFNRGMSKYRDDRDSYTSTMQILTAIIALALFIIFLLFHEIISGLIGLPDYIIAAMFLELIVTPAISFWTIRKRYEFIYRPVVIRTLLMLLFNTVIGVLAVIIFEEKGYARILSTILVNTLFGIMLFFINSRSAKKVFVWEYARFAILFNIPLLIHYLSIYVLDQFDKIMVQKMVSIEAAAIYGVAYHSGTMLKIVTQSLHQTLVPWQYGKLKEKRYKEIDNTLYILLLAISAIMICFALCAPELMMILGGSKYNEARFIIAPVALGMLFSFAYSFFASIEFYYDINKFTMYISLGAAILNVVLNFFGIMIYGYIAAAWTTALCYLVMAVAHFIYMTNGIRKKEGVALDFKVKRMVFLTIAVTLATILIVFLYPYIIIRYILLLFSIAVVFIKRKQLLNMYKQIRSTKQNKGHDVVQHQETKVCD